MLWATSVFVEREVEAAASDTLVESGQLDRGLGR
jgi:hypothetical protein